ncbi:unnamed protein product [Pieris macdunnoughi]|uniref:Zonadhesin n=1 Tax=Pieris macdunnoughi TaxID=345717 RepID=A0A821RKK6_9NEOP|nr:unnamed protein product [Pieris macdunnoughi]
MKPKTIAFASLLVVTISLVQGLPRSHRFKPVVNLNPEKVTTTQKPIEVRKSTLFPKNTKKYVITDKPLPRVTAPSSYKYFLAKRPLMLKFEPTSSFLRNGPAVPHQSLMKKVNFVVSTPSPYEKNSKKSYWDNQRPIHIRNNKTTEDNVVNNTMPRKPNENKDKITAQPQLNIMNTTMSTKAPKNETREIILLPINEQELKSNPNAIADEVSDIIAFVNKLHETKENISKIGSTTQQPIDKRTLIHPTMQPSTKVTESSLAYPTHEHTTIKNQDNGRKQTPNEDVIQPNSSSTTEKTAKTLSPVQKDTITKSYSVKGNKDETNETAPEIVFIPVNISELKSHPDLIAEEVKHVVNDISKHASQVTQSTTVSTTVASISSSPTTSMVTTTASEKATPVTMGLDEPEIIIIGKGKSFPSSNSSSEDRQNPNDDVENVIYLLSNKNLNKSSNSLTTKQFSYPAVDAKDVQPNNSFITKGLTTTPLTPIQKETITESYSLKGNKNESSAPEIVFIPVDLSDLKSHPNLIAEEVKNTVNEIKKHTSTVSESSTTTTVAITSTSTNPSITTTPTVTTQIPMGPEEPEIEITAKGEHSPSSNNSKYSQNPDDDVKNIIYHTPVLHDSNNDVTTETSTNVAISSANNSSPEILFIPVNLDELKSHPNLIANEMKDIIDNINRHPPKIDITTTTSTVTNEAATVLTTITPATTSTTTTTSTPVIENSVNNQNPNTEVTTEQSEATPKVDKPITSSSSHDMIFLPVNLADLKAHPNAIEDEIKDVVNLINDNPNNKKKSETTATPSPKIKEVVPNTTPREYKIITSTSEPLSKHMSNPESIVPVGSSDKQISPEIIFIPVNLKDFELHPNDVNDEIQDIVNNMDKPKSSDETNLTDKSLTTMNKDHTTESSRNLLPMQLDDKPMKNESKNMMATENSLPTSDMLTGRSSTQADFQSSTISLDDITTENAHSKENVTAEKPPEVVFIPVNLNDLESNPAIADEVRDIVDFMNKLHPHDNKVTASLDPQKNTPQESDSPKSTGKVTHNVSSMPTTQILSTTSTSESSVRKYSQNLETDATTESLVKSSSDASLTPSKEDHVTTESLQREIVFIPIKLEELKSNPDLVADEVKDIVNYMNEKDKTNNNTTEQYTTEKDISSIKTTSEIPADTTTLKTSTITETTDNIVTPKYIIIEPIEVTALKDEDENDIYVGNILRRPKVTNKQNDNEKNKGANKSGRSNSISDDISDVIYVIKKNKNNT